MSTVPGVSPELREHNLERLVENVHDVLVVGGGINGASSAAALAGAGASVALVDRGDFANFTSQESSNLVWGGVKYLENYELGLVWKLCASRNELIRSYPANVREIRFFAPLKKTAKGFKRMIPALYAGTWLYWLMGRGFTRPPRWLSLSTIRRDEPVVDASLCKGGVEYSDAYLLDNDARFVFGFVRTALNHGARVANYLEVGSCTRGTDGLWEAMATDRVSGRELKLRSRVLLNAAGPFVDEINERNGIETDAHHLFSKGIHLIVDRVSAREHVLTFFDETDRMFFVIPQAQRSVIGTTDTRVERPQSVVTDEDRAFVLDNVNRRLALDKPLTVDDVIAERCGVRPLVVEGPRTEGAGEGSWTSLSRKHAIDVDDERACISIFGGKLTDCLNIGNEIVELASRLGVGVPRREHRWYGEPPESVRREFLKDAASLGLDERFGNPSYELLSDRLWRRYGTGAFDMLEEIGRDPRMGEPIATGTQYRRCELRFAARREMVVQLEDFLRRRTKIGLVYRREQLVDAEGMREACDILAGGDGQVLFHGYFGKGA